MHGWDNKVRAWWLTLVVSALLMTAQAFADDDDDKGKKSKRKKQENEVVYFVLPDRFYNGDRRNDTGGIDGGREQHGFDPTDKGFYHGGDLKGLSKKLNYIDQMGVTAIWISPPFKNKPVIGATAGYHGYWALDYTQVDPHWGSKKDLRDFIRRAHKKDIRVYFDVVLNHTADVIKYEECHNPDGSLLDGLSNCPYRSLIDSQTNPYTPFLPAGDENAKSPAWLNDPAFYHNQGDSTFAGESSQYGDFFGLDDLKTEDPQVLDGMLEIFKGWISDFHIDGFRVDTVKHVNTGFWQQWVPAIEAHAASQGIDDFLVFGEVFDGNPGFLSQFTRDAEFPSLLDFGLYFAIRDVVADTQGTERLEWVFGQDDRFTNGETQANRLMNFTSNHDIGRIGHFIQQRFPNISDDEALARAKLAQSLIYLSRGTPVIYYGDEQGFTGDGENEDTREDMFASQVDSYNDNDLIGTDATTARDNFNKNHPLFKHIKSLSKLYRKHPGLNAPAQFVRHAENGPGLFAMSKYDADSGDEYVIVLNTSLEERSLELPVDADKYKVLWSSTTPARNDDDDDDDDDEGGKGNLKAKAGLLPVDVEGLEVLVLQSHKELQTADTLPDIAFAGLVAGDLYTGVVEVRAQLSNISEAALPLHRVHFSMQVNGGEFAPLGTDYNPDYRVFVNLSDLNDGDQIVLRASVDNYGNQSNSVEIAIEKGLVPGMQVFFQKPADWDELNIYWFNSAPQADVDWPGVPMTNVIEDWYTFTFDDGVREANIIFNNGGNGSQTIDLFRRGDGCYDLDSNTWFDSCDIPEPGMWVYFQKPADWADSINIYWFDSAPQADVGWPGVPMDVVGEGWYRFQFDTNVTFANIIFNDGNGNQTSDLQRSGDGCFVNGDWLADCDPPEPGLKVYFKKPTDWADSVNLYWFDTPNAPTPAWPGEPMQAEGNDWFSFQFPLNATAANLIFNDGSGKQTADLFRDSNGCYIDGGWVDSCDTSSAEPGMKVYFKRPLDWNVPNLHYWYEGGGSAWPGEEMDSLGDDWYVLQLPDGVTAANMVINDKTDGSNGNQTADLYREGDGCYDLTTDSWSDSCPTPGFTVFFQKPDDWTSPFAYFWNPSPFAAANVGWPGEPMADLGESWYSYQFPNGVQAANLIFNNAGNPQTGDLFREGDGCYSLDGGWTDSCDYPKPGMTVYFYKPDGWGDDINIYYWNIDGSPAWPGITMTFLGDGLYSFTFPQGVDAANLIFNDGQGNQTDNLYREDGGCFGEFGDSWRKSCLVPSDVQVEIRARAAHWLTPDTLAWQVSDSRASQFRLYYSLSAGISAQDNDIIGFDGFVALQSAGTLSSALQAQNPHLASWSAYSLNDSGFAETMLQGQLVVAAMDSSGNLLEATRVQTPRVIDSLFTFEGDLGVQYANGAPSVSLWAPTAQSVELVRYDQNFTEIERLSADAVTQGTYQFTGNADWDKSYYRFAISVYHPISNAIESYEVTDPYSVSLSQNSRYSQFLDLAGDATLKPNGWDSLQKALPEHQDITLYEGHLRDFSQGDLSVPAEYRGTYMAFTYNGENGRPLSDAMAHLRNLQQAGLSHFHLLPVFDITSIDEDPANQVDLDDPYSRLCAMSNAQAVQNRCAAEGDTPIREVLTNLAQQDPSTAEIQSIVAEMVNRDRFNWGYDPFHFNAPEGSYATATDGETRVREFRAMVQALAEIDLNVVMDVVYNHTSASGLFDNSVLDKVVPGYYHRLNPVSGGVENSTCCDNTATEHRMMEKLMVDTLVHWAKFFKIDSFRFDLMGHIPKSSMQLAQQALAGLNLANDGVDGAKIYLYGEGWNFGEVANNQRFEQATQQNMAGTGIATFNDRLRSAVRGGNFTDTGRAQGWANGNELFPNGYTGGAAPLNDQADRIRIGLTGNLADYPFIDNGGNANTGGNYAGVGYTQDPQESVNYVDKHDNETLWDNSQAKLPDSLSADERVRVHLFSNALINYGQGVPFYQMGTDLLRSKSLDRNSYNSGDWFNAVDFTAEDNNWAVGLPLAQDNQSRWSTMADIINNGNIRVQPSHIQSSVAVFQDQLRVRYSSPLFRLATAEDVIQRVGFHNTGASQQGGVIAMTLSDGVCAGNDLDPNYDGILVLFNADDQTREYSVAGTDGSVLHPVLASGSDELVKTASVTGDSYSIPAHSAAVFVKPQAGAQGDYPCNPQAADDAQPGFTVYVQKPAEWQDIRVYYWNTAPVDTSISWPGAELQALGSDWYSFQFPNGVQSANLIFNNNNQGQQTGDLFRDGDGCYDIATNSWTDSCALPGLQLYFQKPVDWSDNVHMHYWNATGIPESDWPGVAMQNLGDGWFYYQMPEGVRSTNLIFNDAADGGTGNQTSDLSRNRDGCYSLDAGWTDSCSVP